MQSISWKRFYRSYRELKQNTPSYRLGQHFINMFVLDENSDEVLHGLWQKDGVEALNQCYQVINKYQWSDAELPLAQRPI